MVHSIVAVDIGNSFIKLAVLTNAPTPLNIQDAQVATFKVEDVGNSQWQALLESCPFGWGLPVISILLEPVLSFFMS